jgi:hypothetical protein
MIVGEHGNLGKVAIARGPLILAADDALNPDAPIGSYAIPLAKATPAGGESHRSLRGTVFATRIGGSPGQIAQEMFELRLTSFAEAGSALTPYQVWLPLTDGKSGGAQKP